MHCFEIIEQILYVGLVMFSIVTPNLIATVNAKDLHYSITIKVQRL